MSEASFSATPELQLTTSLQKLTNQNEFTGRHIGASEKDVYLMLKELGFSSLDDLARHVIPKSIVSTTPTAVGGGISENALLIRLKSMMAKNKIYKSYIGMGYHDCIVPSVILRNVFENPVWYTAYTPYQAEIAQGRLESLLNFQTMVKDLTAMEIANASLLDEGTAAAEAMAMAHALCKKSDVKKFVVSPQMHPHVIEVLKTRAEPLGFELILEEPNNFKFDSSVFALFVQYPNTLGCIESYKNLAEKTHEHGALLIASVDLLALTLLTPPGEWGADIVVGNSQRFGVPMGFGGPHAAFMATKDSFKRLLPGRLVGLSVDSQGQPALRLALQTREQHIRREKATSNICTAQVLLANMASMYAVFHGPAGLRKIALRVHRLTAILERGLTRLGFKVAHNNYFDTLTIETEKSNHILAQAERMQINLRKISSSSVGVSLNETAELADIEEILQAFNSGTPLSFKVQDLESEIQHQWPAEFVRKSKYLEHPVFNSHHSETELMRYIHLLQNRDLTLTHSMIPLGSCTMKLNAATELIPVSWPEVNKLHPFAPIQQAAGYLELIHDLEAKLSAITGFPGVSLQPNAGSQGEYAGLLVVREYFKAKNQGHRNVCLIPSSAHGTNPASAVMAGMDVVVVNCDDNGNIDVGDLQAKAELHKEKLAALMITYPSTHGVFEESIVDICKIMHSLGAQVYMDGANLNALVGICKPGEFGPDVMHMNLHKTFSIPHGGGGPGIGPIAVAAHLKPFLPKHSLVPEAGPKDGISATTSAPWGSASILPISWSYITMMGEAGLQRATLVSILNANYIAKKLNPYFPVLYKGREGLVAHECILDARGFKKSCGIEVTDIAKRLIDYGFHAPTMSWPVAGTLMVEPTESESKPELDRFIEAMISIRKEIESIETGSADSENNVLKNSPHTAKMLFASDWKKPYTRESAAFPIAWLKNNKYWPSVARVDNAYGDRHLVCACPPLDDYK